MAHAIKGDSGAVSFGGGSINGKLQEWKLTLSANEVSDRGAGEDWASRISTEKDWIATFKAYALDQADWSIAATTSETDMIGTDAAIALKRKSTDTNPYFTGTGLVTKFERTHAINNPSEYDVEVKCSGGVAPTIDTTPAT